MRADLLARINALRAAGTTCGSRGAYTATQALAWDDRLEAAALGHADDMASNDYFSHDSLDGSTMVTRIEAQGYTWTAVGENIAAGQATVDSVMQSWQNSDGHCANLMNPDFEDIGVACVSGTAGASYGTYWVMDLGRAP